MSVVQATVLGIIQGLTEFLPVSSSGHLAIAEHRFGAVAPLAFDVLLHSASVVAILAVLRRDVWALLTTRRRLILPLVVGMLPVAVAGLLLKRYFELAKHVMPAVGASLMFTGLVVAQCERVGRRSRDLAALGLWDALVIGLAQTVALVPGISRSGMTISGGLFRGMTRDACVRFSFLLGIPAILGASMTNVPEMIEMAGDSGLLPLAAGAAASLISSMVAITFLLRLVRQTSLAVFAYYCVPLGMAVFVLSAPQTFAGWLTTALHLHARTAVVIGYMLAVAIVAAVIAIVFSGALRQKRPPEARVHD